MQLDEFLQMTDADLPSLVAGINAAIGLMSDDLVLAVGSLVEGLGTGRSDVDLMLITSRAESDLPTEHEHAFVVGRCLADVRVLQLARVNELLSRLDVWSRQRWTVNQSAKFTQEERVVLHRLLHGRVLPHDRQGDTPAVPRPTEEAVARLKLHAARQLSRTVQVDMAGHRDSLDSSSLVFAAQDLLGHTVDALTASHGLTNPNPKWRSRMLECVPDDWELVLGSRPSLASAKELVWQLHRAPENPEPTSALQHASRITAFSRAVFVAAERRLIQSPPTYWPTCWPNIEHRQTDTTLPHLDLDVDYLLADGEVLLARLNAFGATLQLSPHEFALALLFDGTTTVREAEAAVGIAKSGGLMSEGAHALLSKIVASNLTAS